MTSDDLKFKILKDPKELSVDQQFYLLMANLDMQCVFQSTPSEELAEKDKETVEALKKELGLD